VSGKGGVVFSAEYCVKVQIDIAFHEGYVAGEIGKFHLLVKSFVNVLFCGGVEEAEGGTFNCPYSGDLPALNFFVFAK